jgi:Tfp pilus assembly protein PilZ
MKSVLQNNRRTYRKACSMMVDYSVRGRFFTGFAKDISLEGVFIVNRHPGAVGEAVQLTLSLPGWPRPLKLDGTIARIAEDGIGVRFNKHHASRNEMLEVLVDRINGGWL